MRFEFCLVLRSWDGGLHVIVNGFDTFQYVLTHEKCINEGRSTRPRTTTLVIRGVARNLFFLGGIKVFWGYKTVE